MKKTWNIVFLLMVLLLITTTSASASKKDFNSAIDVKTIKEGMIAFQTSDEKWGFSDTLGNTVISPQWDFVKWFNDGCAMVFKGEVDDYGFADDGNYGFIDIEGNTISDGWDDAKDFNEGYAAVKKNGKWGLIDSKGNLVIPCEKDMIYDVNHERAMVFSGTLSSYGSPEKGYYSFIDMKNNTISEGWENAHGYSDGYAPVMKDGKWGFIDTEGNLVIPCEWDYCQSFSNGYVSVFRGELTDYNYPDRGVYSFIDAEGNVLSEGWEDAGIFSDGFAYVKENGKYGYIDVEGNLVIPCTWDDAYNFNDGVGVVFSGGLTKYGSADAEKGTFYMLDVQGNTLGEIVCDAYPSFYDGYAWVEQKGIHGLINPQGETVLDFQWEDSIKVVDGKTLAEKDKKWYIVDVETGIDQNGENTNSTTFKENTEVYDFRQFVWGDSKEEVIAKEGRPSSEGNVTGMDADYIVYETTAVGLDMILGYYFCDEGLFRVRYILAEDHSNEALYIDDYNKFKSALTKKYGDPFIDHESWLNDSKKEYYADDKGTALCYGYLNYLTMYFTDRSYISMEMSADNYEITMTVDYESSVISPGEVDYSDDI